MTIAGEAPWVVPLAGVAVLLIAWLLWRWFFGRGTPLQRALAEISYDRVENLVIPSADEGEIQIDQLLLTSQGLLILEIKDVEGTVFGSDKMSDWTVIAQDRRFTFPNPQPGLFDRIAAVKQIVREVPVAGRVLFLDGAEFTKGVPSMVCDLDELLREFAEPNKDAARFKIDAFKPHWELIRNRAD